jgi:hypothetical protein
VDRTGKTGCVQQELILAASNFLKLWYFQPISGERLLKTVGRQTTSIRMVGRDVPLDNHRGV